MISKRDIVCFANDWRSDPTSKHQIMKKLAERNRVLWINSIGLRRPTLEKHDISRIINKVRSFSRGLEVVGDNFHVLTPLVIPLHGNTHVRRLNAMILKLMLDFYIRKFDMKNIIYWSYLPNAGYILKRLKPKTLIYHCVDEWSKFSFIDENIIDEEKELCEMSDLVIASARSLLTSRQRFNPNTHYISHGVDYHHFHRDDLAAMPVPDDMAGISKPIAGFFGLIHEWIDLDLLDFTIRRNPNVSFVFIGSWSVDIDKLEHYPNAHFLGRKTYDDLVRYAAHFDVGLIPFKINELTINVNPIKLKEYFALGVPTISVRLPEIEVYEHAVRIADDYEAFDRAVKEETAGHHVVSVDEMDAIARSEMWEQKVEEISDLIDRI